MFLISDTHFFHTNIIKYADRPFGSVKEMNDALVQRWNEVVGEDDIVLHLGDVSFSRDGRMWKIGQSLKGKKQLVLGNHDWGTETMSNLGFECKTTRRNETYEFEYEGRHFVVAHRPRDIPTWEKGDTRIRICGHEHNNAPHFIKWVRDKSDNARPIMCLNMSCEYTDYAPLHISEVIERYDHYMKQFAS